MAKKQESKTTATKSGKRVYISQSDMPKITLSESLRLARGLYDDFAGKSAAPHQLAMSIDVSPTSSAWRDICGASIAYGLTEGGAQANKIKLMDLGKRIVAPTKEGDNLLAQIEATLKPRILNQFFDKYDRAKLPSDKIAQNVLAEMGAPHDRLDSVLEVIKRNGEFVGLIHQTKTGPFVAKDQAIKVIEEKPSRRVEGVDLIEEKEEEKGEVPVIEGEKKEELLRPHVFISHGKNKQVVSQLKDLLIFGKFTPVIAEEHETTSKPVPDKVLEDMRSCYAGIIHVEGEEELLDKDGNVHHKINENVLIEIGAAMALYKRNLILLVQKGIHLPSNLQGLYRCEYEGKKLDYEATMKLLKAFNEFK